jgi:RimJ/RimL family protein N-acetyltransferase
MNNATRRYPRTVHCKSDAVTVAALSDDDREALTAFVARLPAHDLLFLRRDITNPKVVTAWIEATQSGEIRSLVAREDELIVGATAVVIDDLAWSRHVGELRVLVEPRWRGRGLGRELIQECFAQAVELGLEKLCAQMTTDQLAAIGVYEGLGFRAEALLRDHVKDRDGKPHDLALLSHDVRTAQAQMAAYGLPEALGSQ